MVPMLVKVLKAQRVILICGRQGNSGNTEPG